MRSSGCALWILSCLLLSCQLDQDPNLNPEIGIREDVVLNLDQTLSYNGASFGFVFTSTVPNQCAGTSYKHQAIITSEDISIHLQSLEIPEPCVGQDALASQKIPLTSYKGTYGLSVNLGENIHNTGVLTIDDEGVLIDMNTLYGLDVPHVRMKRIPNGMIWGTVYHPTDKSEILELIRTQLGASAEEADLADGYYGHFRIAGNGAVTVPAQNLSATSFIYYYNGTAAMITEQVDLIKAQLPEDTQFRLYTWLGAEY